MKNLLLLTLLLPLSACDTQMDWNIPDSVAYQSAGWYQAYPSTLDGAAYYPPIAAHDCTDGWLYIIGDPTAVLNGDGSHVVCDPVPVWWLKTERVL